MTGWQLFTSAWDFHPSVVAGCVLLWLIHFAAFRFQVNRKTVYFTLGVAVMFFALVSPIDALNDYLFSVHMLQHIMLGLIAPPLFILGLPDSFVRASLSRPFIDHSERILGYPLVAWLLGIGTLWIWHWAPLYNATVESEPVHVFEHLTLLVTGTILWWPVLNPIPERRLASLIAVVYLLFAAFANALLGIIFTVSDTPFYSCYAHPHDELGALSLIRNKWGLGQLNDQKLGGAFMWAIGSIIFLWAIMAIVMDWYKEPEIENK